MGKAFEVPRLIGLLALLAGFMSFSATVAQAEPGAYWEVGGTQIKDKTLLPEINIAGAGNIVVLTKIGLSTIEYDCAVVKSLNGLLHELGRFTSKIHFENCITKLNKSIVPKCTPHSPGAPEGFIETEPLEGLLKLHVLSKEPLVDDDVFELLPVNAEMHFVTLELGTGGCSIANNISMTGTIFLKDSKNKLLENQIERLFEEFKPLTKFLFGGNPMTIDGSFWAFLQGPHTNQLWSGHPA